jgi:hypothetical protein
VSNIEQISSALRCNRFCWGWGQIEGRLMYTSQPAVQVRRQIVIPGRRAFGVQDRPPCLSCGAEMHLIRRSPEPRHNTYEIQIFSCITCDAEITRVVDCNGKPRLDVLIELETAALSVRAGMSE